MKSLAEYIAESSNSVSLTDYINESFFDYDTALENVPAKMKDVEKIKILVKKFDNLGEENEYEEGKSLYERLLNTIKNNTKEKQWSELMTLQRYNSDYDTKIKNRCKFCDKLFSIMHNMYKKDKQRGWGDPNDLVMGLLGTADWLIQNGGFKKADEDKYLGKLANKFNKLFNIDADDATEITKMYDKKKVSIQTAVDMENATKASVEEIKNDFKNHKYTIFAGSHDSAAEAYIVENADFESLDDAFAKTVGLSMPGSGIEKYDLDKKLRGLVKDGSVNALYLCSGYYCFGEDKEKTLPTFGYLDDFDPNVEIYKYSTYDSKFYYSGKPSEKKSYYKSQAPAYHYYDSLWTVHKR